MAAIYLDNLVKPKQSKSTSVSISKEASVSKGTYVDLHLDMEFANNTGHNGAVLDKDIKTDLDAAAIRNSIFNIFSTRPGWKVLTPNFGCRLDRYLFEPISDFRARLIGNEILTNLTKFEPRINVSNVIVKPVLDEYQYHISIIYSVIDTTIADKLDLKLMNQHNNGGNFLVYGQ